jgi:hypothetical protein
MNRFLTIFGETRKYSSVVYDSVFDPKVGQFQHSHFNYDLVIRRIFNNCDQHTFCGTFFANHFHGKTAKRVLDETFENLEKKQSVYQCIKEITNIADPSIIHLKSFFVKGLDAGILFPSILFKLNRCSTVDITQLKRIKNFFDEVDYAFWPQEAFVANIYMSEMYHHPNSELLTKEKLLKQEHNLISLAINSKVGIDLYQKWKKYPRDEFMYKYPNVKIPTLVIMGDEDEATPLQWGMVYAQNTNSHLYRIPRTGHWASLNRRCVKLVNEFFTSNGANIDDSCRLSIPEYDFEAKTDSIKRLAFAVFGTTEIWK